MAWVYETVRDSKGVLSIPREEYEATLSEYFRLRGWDQNGIPTRETLHYYDLDDIADDLAARGVLEEESGAK